jgi:hypothetical protein
MIGVAVDELNLAAPGIIVRFREDVAAGIGDNRRCLEVIGEIIRNVVAGEVPAGYAVAVEEKKKMYSDVRFPVRSLSPTMPKVVYQ